MAEKEVYPAMIIEVIDRYKVVINRGSKDGVKLGQRFLIYTLSDKPLIDPNTKETLGHLEYVLGRGKVIHVQERIATIESDEEEEIREVIRSSIEPDVKTRVRYEKKSFGYPNIGSLAKPV